MSKILLGLILSLCCLTQTLQAQNNEKLSGIYGGISGQINFIHSMKHIIKFDPSQVSGLSGSVGMRDYFYPSSEIILGMGIFNQDDFIKNIAYYFGTELNFDFLPVRFQYNTPDYSA